jgi:hypothetical protein
MLAITNKLVRGLDLGIGNIFLESRIKHSMALGDGVSV